MKAVIPLPSSMVMTIVTVIFSVLQLGCVAKSKYQRAQDDLTAANQQSVMLANELKECKARASTSDAHQQECSTSLANATGELQRLRDLSSNLASNLSDTQQAIAEMKARQAQQDARIKTYRDLIERFQKLIKAGQLDVKIQQGRMVVNLNEKILFDSLKADLKPEGMVVLEEVTRVLNDIPNRHFQIEGHTDNLAIRNSPKFASNWELSSARAMQVVSYMISKGLSPNRLSAAAYGEFAPVAPNDTPENRARNRRIEIVLMPNLDELPFADSSIPAE